MNKTCVKCLILKEINNFYKKRNACKTCYIEGRLIYQKANLDKVKTNKKLWNKENPNYQKDYLNLKPEQKIKKQKISKTWITNNPEKILLYRKKFAKKNPNYKRQWDLNYPEYRTEYIKNRCHSDPLYRLIRSIRCLIGNSIRRQGFTKKSKVVDLIGCSFEELQKYLMDTVIKRYGVYNEKIQYHIDHIIPCVSATTEQELNELQHYSNLQLLTAEDNLKKGGTYEVK